MTRSEYMDREKGYSAKMRGKIMTFIKSYINEHEYPPSYKEIGNDVGLAESSVFTHMSKLFDLGELETDLPERFHTPRAYRIARKGRNG